MTIPAWQPATTYAPGALVVPRSAAPPAFTGLLNPTLSDTTGWDLDSPLQILADAQGFGGEGRIAAQGTTNGANAINQAHIPLNPGQSISVSAMCAHGTSDKHSSDGAVVIHYYKSDNTEILPATQGAGLAALSNAGWQGLSASGIGPAAVAYCRIGCNLYRHSTDTIQISHFQISYTPQSPARATMYEATQTKPGKSAGTEPIWPPLGSSVQDNEVTWNGVNIDRLVWQASPLLETGATEPTWPTFTGGTVHDGTVDWVAASAVITDPNCPHSKIVAIMASKVFAGDKDIVRFCATANALDWTSQQDAGYLPTGLQQSNSNDMAVLAPYRSNLTAFNASCFQNWQVDPDPAAMALLDQMEGIGSVWQLAAHPVGNELYYLSQLGVRSVSIAAGADNLKAGDVGTPIDSLVQASLSLLINDAVPLATYYPSAGQYWLAFRNPTLQIVGGLVDGAINDETNGSYQVSGAVDGYTVAVVSGALPPGVTLLATGAYSGAYTTAGSYTWTVRVTDGAGRFVDLVQNVTVSTGVVISLLHFDTGLTDDPTGRAWALESGTALDAWGLQPVTVPYLDSTLAEEGSAMSLLPDTANHGGGFDYDYIGGANFGVSTGFGADAPGTNIDFCVELYVRPNLHSRNDNGAYAFVGITTSGEEFIGAGRPNSTYFALENTSIPVALTPITTTNPSAPKGAYFHYAVTRQGDLVTVWYNGNAIATFSGGSTWNIDASAGLYVGNSNTGSLAALGWEGQVDEVRVTKGWARYTEPFTPPTGAIGSATNPPAPTEEATADVYVFTMNAGKGKWSRYTFPFSVDAFAQLGNDCYIRHGDFVSKIDESAVADDVNGAPVNFDGTVQWGWLDCGPQGLTKMLHGFDIVASGNPSVSIGYDQTDASRFTTPYAVGPDTVPGTIVPLPVSAPSFSPKVTFPGGEKWSVQSMSLYLDDMAGQP